MDECLTQKIPVTMPSWQAYTTTPSIPGYTEITSLTPILGVFFGSMPTQEGQIQSTNLFHKTAEFEGSGSCQVHIIGKKQKKKAFCKVTHLLDPIHTIKGYYDHPEKGVKRRQEKLENPMNQAYVDALANYLLGQLRERNISPHFCFFYGGFKGIAEKYRYNITDEFESYRKYREFWNKKRKGLFSIYLRDNDEEIREEDLDEEDAKWLLKTPSSSLRSTPFSYITPKSTNSTNSTSLRSHISLNSEEVFDISGACVEIESIPGEFEESEDTLPEESEEDESDFEENSLNLFIELKKYPVMLIFQEEMEGVLDTLLEEDIGELHGSPEWEAKWTAWTFQIITALCVAQGVLGFTHNDLHTNNIVWAETTEPWLFYKSRNGTVWRVPTYGKIFRIIDFGRSIFRVGETWYISDDYEKGGDADGQYSFGKVERKGQPLVYPNPSFDLCRYSVSIIEALFPEMPSEKTDGFVISREEDWEIRETVSPLWNLLWSWLLDDEGKNVLKDKDQTERFPDFDLYQHISAHVHNAKPQEQIHKEIFRRYQISAKEVGDWETVYPLFC